MLAEEMLRVQAEYEDYLSRTPLRQVVEPRWYDSPGPGFPDLLALRLPHELSRNRVEHDEIGRTFKVVFSETVGDRDYLEACLDRSLPIDGIVVSFRSSVDRTNMRASTIARGSHSLSLYPPPAPGWPHILVVAAGGPHGVPDLFRGAYTWHGFDDATEAGKAWALWLAKAESVPGRKIDCREPRPGYRTARIG